MTENSTKITKKPATSVKKNSSVKGSSKNKKRKKEEKNKMINIREREKK